MADHESKTNVNTHVSDEELNNLLNQIGVDDSPIEHIHDKIEKELEQELHIGLFGPPGVGKSTLMNQIAGKKVADAGIKPGVEVKEERWGENDSIIFKDLPGFDGLPDDHSEEKYWEEHEVSQLDVLLCMFESKLTQKDVNFFKQAIAEGISVIFVRSKSDTLFDFDKSKEELQEEIKKTYIHDVFGANHDLLFVSSKTGEGLEDLQKHISDNLDSTLKEKFYRNAKGYSESFLELKKEASKKTVLFYATISAGAGATPILGMPVDVANTIKMVKAIALNFNLSENRISQLETRKEQELKDYNAIFTLINHGSKEAIKRFMAKHGSKEVVKRASTGAPIVGAGVSFAITWHLGIKTIDESKQLAERLMEYELEQLYG